MELQTTPRSVLDLEPAGEGGKAGRLSPLGGSPSSGSDACPGRGRGLVAEADAQGGEAERAPGQTVLGELTNMLPDAAPAATAAPVTVAPGSAPKRGKRKARKGRLKSKFHRNLENALSTAEQYQGANMDVFRDHEILAELEELRAEVVRLKGEAETYAASVREAEGLHEEVSRRLEVATTDLQEARGREEELASENAGLRAELEAGDGAPSGAETSSGGTTPHDNLGGPREELEETLARAAQSARQNEELQEELKRLSVQSDYFQEEISMWETEFDGLQRERDALAATVSEQRTSLGEARSENARLQERLLSVEAETGKLVKDLEGARVACQDSAEKADRSRAEACSLKRRLAETVMVHQQKSAGGSPTPKMPGGEEAAGEVEDVSPAGSPGCYPAPQSPEVHLAAIQMEYEYTTAALQAELERYQVENRRLRETAESLEGQAAETAAELEGARAALAQEQSVLSDHRAGAQQEQVSLKREWGRSQQEAQALKLKLKVALKRLREEEIGAKKSSSDLRQHQERIQEVSAECQALRGDLQSVRNSALKSQEEAARAARSLAESESRLSRAHSDADEARASHLRLLRDFSVAHQGAGAHSMCSSCSHTTRKRSKSRSRRRHREDGTSESSVVAVRCLQELGFRAVLSAWGLERDRKSGGEKEDRVDSCKRNKGAHENKDATTSTEGLGQASDSRGSISAVQPVLQPPPGRPLISPRAPVGAPPAAPGRRAARMLTSTPEPGSLGSCASSSSPLAEPACPMSGDEALSSAQRTRQDAASPLPSALAQASGTALDLALSPRCGGATGVVALAETAARQLEEARFALDDLRSRVPSGGSPPSHRGSKVKSLPEALAAAASRLEEDMARLGFGRE